jgi:hypothetical protein
MAGKLDVLGKPGEGNEGGGGGGDLMVGLPSPLGVSRLRSFACSDNSSSVSEPVLGDLIAAAGGGGTGRAAFELSLNIYQVQY